MRRRVPAEFRIMVEDRLLQLPQLWPRLDTELVGKQPPCPAERSQRLGLPPRPVQRLHELPVEPLMVRIGDSQGFQFRGHVLGPAEPEIGVDAPLQREQALPRQPPRRVAGERRLCDIGEGIAAPQAERAAQHRRGLVIVAPASRRGRLRHELLKPERIHPVAPDVQQIPRRFRHEHLVRRPIPENAADPREVGRDRVLGGRWRIVPPQVVDQPGNGNGVTRVQNQVGQQRPLFRPAQPKNPGSVRDLDRPQDAELEVTPPRHGSNVAPAQGLGQSTPRGSRIASYQRSDKVATALRPGRSTLWLV